MSLYEALKSVHVLAIAIWLGGGFLQLLFAERARRAAPAERLAMAERMEFSGTRVFGPAAGVALLTGIGMVADSDFVSFGDAWITIAMTGWIASGSLGSFVLGRTVKAVVAAGGGEAADAAYSRVLTIARIDFLILVAVLVDMVVKPA